MMANDLAYKIKELREVHVNDIVLHPIYRPDGLLFVKKDKKLTESIIGHLQRHFPPDYPLLVVESEEKLQAFLSSREDHEAELYEVFQKMIDVHQSYMHVPLSLELYDEQLARWNKEDGKEEAFVKQIHPHTFIPMAGIFEQTFDSARLLDRLQQINEQLNKIISKDESIFTLFSRISQYHDVLTVHSVNTTCISLMIGVALELSDEELIELAIATLFADIGFTEVPKEEFVDYLNSGKRNEALIKEHLRLSVEIISQSPFCRRKAIMYGIFDHHEEYGGTGFPNHKQKDEIHLFGRIIAIAQLYDELVGGYVREESRLSVDAIEEVWRQAGSKIDPHIFRIFLEKSRIYKIGEWVRLSNNELAQVIGFKDYVHYPVHPIVRKHNGQIYDFSTRL